MAFGTAPCWYVFYEISLMHRKTKLHEQLIAVRALPLKCPDVYLVIFSAEYVKFSCENILTFFSRTL